MTIILANAIIHKNSTPSSSQFVESTIHYRHQQHHHNHHHLKTEKFSIARHNGHNEVSREFKYCEAVATDFDLVIPSSSLNSTSGQSSSSGERQRSADVMKMNDKEANVVVGVNKNCDKICEINNNIFEMGVKYHTPFNGQRLTVAAATEEESSSSMSPKIYPKSVDCDRRSRKPLADDRQIDNGGSVAAVVVDNYSTRNGEQEEVDDCGGDNDSVLSVGRDENNFESDVNHDEEEEEKPSLNHMEVDDASNRHRVDLHESTPVESTAADAAPMNSGKLNLGLTFRNIHNHLTSLKNYSPFDMFSAAVTVSTPATNMQWKNSAFQATKPNAFNCHPGLTHPTMELLQRYDMLRANLTHPGFGNVASPTSPATSEQQNLRQFHEDSLKFSIDNILKADFGRSRITDPINKLRKISNTVFQTNKLPTTSHSSLSTFDPMSPTSTASSSSSPTLRSPPPPSGTPSSTTTTESPSKVFSPIDLTAGKGGSGSSAGSEVKNPVSTATSKSGSGTPMVWPAWVYCTRYSDRPSSGRSPRTRKPKKQTGDKRAANGAAAAASALPTSSASSSSLSTMAAANASTLSPSACSSMAANSSDSSCSNANATSDDKRPRTAFSGPQLARLKHEFNENRYLTEKRRQHLSGELGLNEAQIKIWFQNKRAKIKKSSGQKNPLALQLMAQGLYNHSTIPLTKEEEKLQDMQSQQAAAASSM